MKRILEESDHETTERRGRGGVENNTSFRLYHLKSLKHSFTSV